MKAYHFGHGCPVQRLDLHQGTLQLEDLADTSLFHEIEALKEKKGRY